MTSNNKNTKQTNELNLNEYVTMNIGDQKFGLDVTKIRDILANQKITPIPLSPTMVAGSLNLRGRIITAVNLNVVLDVESKPLTTAPMNVVIETNNSMYSLIVDSVGDVLDISQSKILTSQENLSEKWRNVATGIFPLQDELLVILDIDKIFKHTVEPESNEEVH